MYLAIRFPSDKENETELIPLNGEISTQETSEQARKGHPTKNIFGIFHGPTDRRQERGA
jgi:hypothetical protein